MVRTTGLPAPAAAPVTPGVPAALVDWFTDANRWSQSAHFAHLMSRPERVSIEDGKAAFWYENQAVWVWGYEPDDADPHVFDRENITNQPWAPSNMRLSVFLVRWHDDGTDVMPWSAGGETND